MRWQQQPGSTSLFPTGMKESFMSCISFFPFISLSIIIRNWTKYTITNTAGSGLFWREVMTSQKKYPKVLTPICVFAMNDWAYSKCCFKYPWLSSLLRWDIINGSALPMKTPNSTSRKICLNKNCKLYIIYERFVLTNMGFPAFGETRERKEKCTELTFKHLQIHLLPVIIQTFHSIATQYAATPNQAGR